MVVWPSVYRVVGSPITHQQRAIAASLWIGDSGAISHTTAGQLLRWDGFSFPHLHATVPRNAGPRSTSVVIHHSELKRIDRVTVDGIRCTSATRTLIDCVSMVDGETL